MKKFFLLSIFLIVVFVIKSLSINLTDIYDTMPDVANCLPGVLKQSEKQKILDYVNMIRKLHKLPAVTWAAEKDEASMEASLMCVANKTLDHYPPPTWECYTDDGAIACAKSNLGMFSPETDILDSKVEIIGWVIDKGNPITPQDVGHRRAILNPFLTKISVGRADGEAKNSSDGVQSQVMNLFYVDFINGDISSTNLEYVAYPYGYYPPELVDPSFYLSFSPIYDKTKWYGNTDIDYSQIQIIMSDADGNTVGVNSISHDSSSSGGFVTNLTWKVADGIHPNTKYTVDIKNVMVNGESKDYTYWFDVTNDTVTEKPSAPILTSPAKNSTGVSRNPALLWQLNPLASSYHFQLSENQDMSSPVYDEDTITTNQFSVSGLKSNKIYFWRVSARNKVGEGSWSAIWNFTTINTAAFIPVLVSPANNSTNLNLPVNLNWKIVANSEAYHLQVSSSSEFNTDKIVIDRSDITNNSFQVNTELSAGNTYFWRVAAKFNGTFDDWSEPWQFSLKGSNQGPLAVNPADSATEVTLTPNLEWQAISDNNYNLKFGSSSNFEDSTLYYSGVIQNNFYKVTSPKLLPNTYYFWKVQGSVNDELTNWSKIYVFLTTENDDVFDTAQIDAPLTVSPMPAINIINLKSDKFSLGTGVLNIYDLNGNIVMSSNVTILAGSATYDVSSLVSGTYFIVINSNNKTFGSVLVKE